MTGVNGPVTVMVEGDLVEVKETEAVNVRISLNGVVVGAGVKATMGESEGIGVTVLILIVVDVTTVKRVVVPSSLSEVLAALGSITVKVKTVSAGLRPTSI